RPPAELAKATSVLSTLRGEDRSRLNSSVLPSGCCKVCSMAWLMSVLVLGGQARNLLQRRAELEVVHLHPVVQVDLYLLGGQRVEHVAFVVFQFGQHLAQALG